MICNSTWWTNILVRTLTVSFVADNNSRETKKHKENEMNKRWQLGKEHRLFWIVRWPAFKVFGIFVWANISVSAPWLCILHIMKIRLTGSTYPTMCTSVSNTKSPMATSVRPDVVAPVVIESPVDIVSNVGWKLECLQGHSTLSTSRWCPNGVPERHLDLLFTAPVIAADHWACGSANCETNDQTVVTGH